MHFAIVFFLFSTTGWAQTPEKIKSQISEDELLSCAADYYLSLNSQGRIEAEFNLTKTISNQSVIGTVQVGRSDNFIAGSSATTSETIAQAKLSKTVIDFAVNNQISSLQKNRDAQKFETSSALLDYLRSINTNIYEFFIFQQDKNLLLTQAEELQKLRDFSEKLSLLKVIDRADFLLLQDRTHRIKLSIAEVENQIQKIVLTLQTQIGFKFENIISTTRPKETTSDTLKLQISKHPLLQSSQLKIESLKYSLQANERDWWPKLAAEVGLNQQLAQSNLTSHSGASPFIALSLSMNFNFDLYTTQKSRAQQTINQTEILQKNLYFREKQTIDANQLELDSLKNKKKLMSERLSNLRNLYHLQLTKFKSGRLTFFQLKDIESDLFDVERATTKLDLQMTRINKEMQLSSDSISKTDANFLKTKCSK